LLRQQGLAKVLEPPEERIGIQAIDEIVEHRELEEKAHSIILLSLFVTPPKLALANLVESLAIHPVEPTCGQIGNRPYTSC
jgi:hypothetical protein